MQPRCVMIERMAGARVPAGAQHRSEAPARSGDPRGRAPAGRRTGDPAGHLDRDRRSGGHAQVGAAALLRDREEIFLRLTAEAWQEWSGCAARRARDAHRPNSCRRCGRVRRNARRPGRLLRPSGAGPAQPRTERLGRGGARIQAGDPHRAGRDRRRRSKGCCPPSASAMPSTSSRRRPRCRARSGRWPRPVQRSPPSTGAILASPRGGRCRSASAAAADGSHQRPVGRKLSLPSPDQPPSGQQRSSPTASHRHASAPAELRRHVVEKVCEQVGVVLDPELARDREQQGVRCLDCLVLRRAPSRGCPARRRTSARRSPGCSRRSCRSGRWSSGRGRSRRGRGRSSARRCCGSLKPGAGVVPGLRPGIAESLDLLALLDVERLAGLVVL